jgi:hypothetical protein
MRASSKHSMDRRCSGLRLSATCGLAPAAVAGHVGQGGPVAVQPAGAPRVRLNVVIDVGQRDAVRVEERRGHAAVVEAGAVAQQGRVVLPQAAQREVQLALHRHQQRAMPLPLQHGAAVCGLAGRSSRAGAPGWCW